MTNNIHVSYDEFADVLYFSIGQPQKSYSSQDENGIVWRSIDHEGRPRAVTIIDYRDVWLKHRSDLINQISSKLSISTQDVEQRLPN